MTDFNKLQKHKEDLLKAEIATLLFNLGKTHAGIKIWKDYFGEQEIKNFVPYIFNSYKDYFSKENKSYFEQDCPKGLFDFINVLTIKMPKDKNCTEEIKFLTILKTGDDSNNINSQFVKKIMFNGCENVNSGIDKGAPTKRMKNPLYISNAFGTQKHFVSQDDMDKKRLCFFQSLHQKMEDNEWYNKPDWSGIRNLIIKEIKSWYSHLLSDNRFPANDVTLWDQVYMTASMFKATMAELYLNPDKVNDYISNPQRIQWQILGVQYDKLKLAEKGCKPVNIQWYREACREIDREIKKYMETELTIANEIYRDETGIYFLIPTGMTEDFGYDLSVDVFRAEYQFIQNEIIQIFDDILKDEVQPVFFISKASRGIMNLTYLLRKAKSLYLYAPYFNKAKSIQNSCGPFFQLCRVCGINPVKRKTPAHEIPICDDCEKREKGRLDNWFKDRTGETIWLDELQDRNSRIALVTLRFELGEWLNGNMLSTFVNRQDIEKYSDLLTRTFAYFDLFLHRKNIINRFNSLKPDLEKAISAIIQESANKDKLKFGRLKSYLRNCDKIFNQYYSNLKLKNDQKLASTVQYIDTHEYDFFDALKKFQDDLKKINQNLKEIFENTKHSLTQDVQRKFELLISNLIVYENAYDPFTNLVEEALNGCKNRGESFQDLFSQLFFGSILGSEFEILLKQLIPSYLINYENGGSVNWDDCSSNDLNTISYFLLQFLLRKNPSPPRLKRIWETTKKFIESIETVVLSLEGLKKKRLVFDLPTDDNHKEGEYECGGVLFWVKDKKAFLITDLEKAKPLLKTAIVLSPVGQKDAKTESKIFLTKEHHTKESYVSLFTLLDPTPVSWQFAVPAECVPDIIEKVQEEYRKEFRYAYGKLPLHIGVVVQNYKSPLYIGLKALRNIRREVKCWEDIRDEMNGGKLLGLLQHDETNAEKSNDAIKYYSLYQHEKDGEYSFYFPKEQVDNENYEVKPENVSHVCNEKKFKIYPNTIDFEYLDSNTRRNDIYYEGGKRKAPWRKLRPYSWEDWEKFEKFKELFGNESGSQLHNLISMFYSLLEDCKDNEESLCKLAGSAVINTLHLKQMSEGKVKNIVSLFGANNRQDIHPKVEIKHIKTFIDIYDFWHNNLKEV